jgi:polysaccharide biosynthesis protein VpsJ
MCHEALMKLDGWIQRANWMAYDPFDGLSSPYASLFAGKNPLLKRVWQQTVRRFPINLRPALGIKPAMSSKAMGFFAQGYLRLYQTHGEAVFLDKMTYCLEWLMQHRIAGFRGYCWGNHFDYQSRGGSIPRGTPTIVWTGLIAHAFLDAYEALGDKRYLAVAASACDFILDELGWMDFEEGVLLRYYPKADIRVHNSSMIGASVLARVDALSANPRYRELAERAVRFTVHHQTSHGAWYYGVGPQWEWIDSFHTGYVLEALNAFHRYTGSNTYDASLRKGHSFFVESFFLPDGTPRYYAHKTLPIDIQCASQAIQTLVNLRALHPDGAAIAETVANWTIANMQDKSGYFYYRTYPSVINKTPMLHWGQATMFAALALLDQYLNSRRNEPRGFTSDGTRATA